MRLIRIALANVNTTAGAVRSNVDRAIALGAQAAEDGATVVVFPEQLVGGYAPRDLAAWRAFVDAQWAELERFAAETAGAAPAFVLGVTVSRAAERFNAAAVVHRGAVLGVVPKERLSPDEARMFAPGVPGLVDEVRGAAFGDLVFDFDFGTLAVEVATDLSSPDGPMRRRSFAGAELIVNLGATPYRVGETEAHREVLATRSRDSQATVAYANLVGGNDGHVFDGGGLVAQNGRVVFEAPRFREGVAAVNVDLDRTARLRGDSAFHAEDRAKLADAARAVRRVRAPSPTSRGELRYPAPPNRSFFLPSAEASAPPREVFCEELLDVLALGVGDYFDKTGAFKTIGVALSGGRDSLLCLYVARRWVRRRFGHLGETAERAKARELLRAFFMPSRYSSAETRAAAEQAAADFDTPFFVSSIDEAYAREINAAQAMLQPGEQLDGLAKQNIQARLRAARMWTWANAASGLFLQTSNLSEKAVGYTTIGGDMEGALSVIANVPKTVVNYLLDYLLDTTSLAGIRLTLERPASAELAEDQEDERELMPFPVLDACVALYVGEKMSVSDVQRALTAIFPEHDAEAVAGWATRFARLFTQSVFKWVQTPLALRAFEWDLDREGSLALPVVQRTEWE